MFDRADSLAREGVVAQPKVVRASPRRASFNITRWLDAKSSQASAQHIEALRLVATAMVKVRWHEATVRPTATRPLEAS